MYYDNYPLCVSRRIDTWQIGYLSNKDPCPKISIDKSEYQFCAIHRADNAVKSREADHFSRRIHFSTTPALPVPLPLLGSG